MPTPPVPPSSDGWKLRWDVVVFFAFTLAAMRHWTELPVHEALGAVIVPVLVIHLWLNRSWISGVLRRAARTLPGEVRFNRAWDLGPCAVALVAIGSGLLVSQHLLPAIGWKPPRNRILEDVHAVSAWVLLVMIGIHLGVHAHWIWSRVRQPRFALVVVLVALAVAGVTRLEVFRQNGAFSRRFRGDLNKVIAALVPSAAVAFAVLVVVRRRRPT